MAKKQKKVEESLTKYRFKGRYIPPAVKSVGAQAIGEAIRAATEGREVNKQKLLEQAKDPNHPLHKCLEWNDKKAGHEYRLYQIRNIVNCVTVEIEGRTITAFPDVRLSKEDTDSTSPIPSRIANITIEEVLSDPDLRRRKANMILNQLIRLRREHQAFTELSVIWRAIDEVAEAW